MFCTLDEAIARSSLPISVKFTPTPDVPMVDAGQFTVAASEIGRIETATAVYLKARRVMAANSEVKS